MRSTLLLPAPLRWAVWLLLAEAVIAGVAGAVLVYQAFTRPTESRVDALALVGFAVVLGSALAGLALALTRRKPRAQAPAIVLNLLAVMAAVLMALGGQVWLAVPLGLAGVVVATLLLTPSTSAELNPTMRDRR